jgi:hypothetical protein
MLNLYTTNSSLQFPKGLRFTKPDNNFLCAKYPSLYAGPFRSTEKQTSIFV